MLRCRRCRISARRRARDKNRITPAASCSVHHWHTWTARGMTPKPEAVRWHLIVEMLIPSVVDDSLAPAGRHVASLFCQQFDPGADWSRLTTTAVERIFDAVQSHCPNFRDVLLGYSALSPADLRAGVWAGWRRYLPRPVVARPIVFNATGARLCALPRSAETALSLRLGGTPGRRCHRSTGSQCGARDRSRPGLGASDVRAAEALP